MNINEYEEALNELELAELPPYSEAYKKVSGVIGSYVMGLVSREILEIRLTGLVLQNVIRRFQFEDERRVSIIVTFLGKNQKRFCLY